ncbi:MAG: xanthine dehydrogenase small subunit [Pseudomonadota bacterium]
MAGPHSNLTLSLNGKTLRVPDCAPTTTLLDWLRYDQGLTGTKEGCAEGDCGACTVVVRDLSSDGTLRQRTVNACIQLLPMMHGKEVITVEHLSITGTPHPVQTAMAAEGGSQCGFCTPGFVMSLWHGHLTDASVEESDVADQLAGNLCRCTGYGPILRAAAAARALPTAPDDRPDAAERLKQMKTRALTHEVADGWFRAPRDIHNLAALIAVHPDATLLAGATDIGLWVTKNGFRPEKIIHLGDCTELAKIEETETGIRIGAAVTHGDAMAALGALCPDFEELWRRFASVQVRAAGTVCGNIANGSPIGDAAPALIAAGATVTLRKRDRKRVLPLEAFFVEYGKQDRQPGEFVESIDVPRPADPEALKIYKISKRFDQDITAVLAAIHVRVTDDVVSDARIALGGMAAIPMRARGTEAALIGRPLDDRAIGAAIRALANDVTPLSDHRASAAYRLKAAQNLLMKYYLERTFGPQRVTGPGRYEMAAP